MQNNGSGNPPALPTQPDPGLPPVMPPAPAAFLQLFIVPGIIVAVLVGLFLLGPMLYNQAGRLLGRGSGDARTAAQFLRDLDNPNGEVRWRAASDLAQTLPRNEELARNVDFALELADRLDRALDGSAEAEKSFVAREGKLSAEEKDRERAKLAADRNYVMYLSASLGNFMMPVGVEGLKKLAVQEGGMETEALAERRRRALLALAVLGENLNRFDKLSAEQQGEMLERFDTALDKGTSVRLARMSRDYLAARRDHVSADKPLPAMLGVAEVLEQCGSEKDPSLRFLAAFASNFWYGTTAENQRLEKLLVKLSSDSGEGEDELEDQLAKNPDSARSRELVRRKGFRVQVNAAIALARRGSPKVRLDLLQEMLDEEKLNGIFVLKPKDGKEQPNAALVTLTLTDTLKALVQLHRKRPEMDLRRFDDAISTLEGHRNPAIRVEAQQCRLALNEGRS
jgi:hypothetical protein